MLTITLTSDLEQAVKERADRTGMTPELVALDTLHREFLPEEPKEEAPVEGTMADFFKGYAGTVDSREIVPGGADLSRNTGRRFKALMAEKHRSGKR